MGAFSLVQLLVLLFSVTLWYGEKNLLRLRENLYLTLAFSIFYALGNRLKGVMWETPSKAWFSIQCRP
ncbi:hypothetical protein [Holospora curviuscula]|uniref:Uncharacterized protein n=1 Tax=Holospora curviuscula TaxID=1082868 RepID=A0A2S5R7E1_9PROT|nr:hypothetical protein [Holospora curviuscula]PPE03259.1 hypothetical protein HCUR_01305 [Holospora curviuscula]